MMKTDLNSLDRYENIAVALAGIVQAIELVRLLAQTGKAPEAPFNACIFSVFQTNAPTLPETYGQLANIKWGLERLVNQMGKSPHDKALSRYILTLIHLQKKLYRRPALLNHFYQRLTQIKKQVDYFHLTHPTVIGNLADIYMNTLNIFHFRITIWGNERILSIHENIEKIRALLLTGVRSAVLWREAGGSRWQFLFARNKIKQAAEKLLALSLHDPTRTS